MASELSLTWDEHQSTLVGVFEKLLTAGALVDCTIAAEGQYIKAHKIILSACSPYFEMLFTEEKEKNPIVVLKDIKFQELKAMIDFIYRGKVKVPEERLGDFVDAAESLQIKGLGVSNRNINSPEQSGNESSAVMRKKEGRVSPLPRKRSRRSYANNNGDNVRGISPVVDITIENPEELRSPMDIPSSSRSDPSPPLVSARDSPSLLPSSECSEQKNLDSSDSLPFVESALPTSEQLPNPETVVVKNEPEPMAEVFIPEIECFIEPKSEDVGLQESMLDCGSGEMEPAAGDNQHSSSQYSAFSTALQASSSSTGRSDNLLLMTDVVDSFNTQGAVSPMLRVSDITPSPEFASISSRCSSPTSGGATLSAHRHTDAAPTFTHRLTNDALMLTYRTASPPRYFPPTTGDALMLAHHHHIHPTTAKPLRTIGDSVVVAHPEATRRTAQVPAAARASGDFAIHTHGCETITSTTRRTTEDSLKMALCDSIRKEPHAPRRHFGGLAVIANRSDSTLRITESSATRSATGDALVRHDSAPSLSEVTTLFRSAKVTAAHTRRDPEAACSHPRYSAGQTSSRKLFCSHREKPLSAAPESTRHFHKHTRGRCNCIDCGHAPAHAMIVETHQLLHYDEKNRHQCDECGVIVNRKTSMQRNFVKTYTGPSA